jgi:chromosome segregation ATPase
MSARDSLQKQIDELSARLKELMERNKAQQTAMEQLQKERDALVAEQKALTIRAEQAEQQSVLIKTERDQFHQISKDLVGRLDSLTRKIRTLEQDFSSLSGASGSAIITQP